MLGEAKGVHFARFPVAFPIWTPDGTLGRFAGRAGQGLSVMLGQNIAAAAPQSSALSHPLVLPLVSTLVLTAQLGSIYFMAKKGADPDKLYELQMRALQAQEEALRAAAAGGAPPVPPPPPEGG
jgi:hypothetical protein